MERLDSEREAATILAALRFWQREGLLSAGREQDVATVRALSVEEIDALCERINCGDDGLPEGTRADREGNGERRADDNDATAGRKPTCPKCGSEDVVADAAARWTTEAPAGWEVSNVFDNGHGCDACGAEDIEFVWWVEASVPPPLEDVPPGHGSGETS